MRKTMEQRQEERMAQYRIQEQIRLECRAAEKKGIVLWRKWPLRPSCLKALAMASKSQKIGAKGGLIKENGQPDGHYYSQTYELQLAGYLDEFMITETGWLVLEKFGSKEDACFPDDYQRKL